MTLAELKETLDRIVADGATEVQIEAPDIDVTLKVTIVQKIGGRVVIVAEL